jgi:hypothetical protein
MGYGQGGPFIGGVFKFKDDDRNPVDEEDDIRPSVVFPFLNGELVDDKELVVLRMLKVD